MNMSDFFDNLGKMINETSKQAVKVSGDVFELTKTSVNIKLDEMKKESLFKEIGKLAYAAYKENPEAANENIADLCFCIDELESSIAAQKCKTAALKNKKFCVRCGSRLNLEMLFCPYCGQQQPEIASFNDCCEAENCDCGIDDCTCGCKDGKECTCNKNCTCDDNCGEETKCGCE